MPIPYSSSSPPISKPSTSATPSPTSSPFQQLKSHPQTLRAISSHHTHRTVLPHGRNNPTLVPSRRPVHAFACFSEFAAFHQRGTLEPRCSEPHGCSLYACFFGERKKPSENPTARRQILQTKGPFTEPFRPRFANLDAFIRDSRAHREPSPRDRFPSRATRLHCAGG